MVAGYLCPVLHAHLPYVRHPEDENFLEEKWFYEAITETYIPLLKVLENLVDDGIDFRLTISLSPPLIGMLTDSLLQERYVRHLNKLRELAAREVSRTKKEQPEVHQCALMYQDLFEEAYRFFHRYGCNLVDAFRQLQDTGCVEVITCAGTHGYLPLIGIQKETTRAKVKIAVDYYEEHFGKKPKGLWLPECGYNPGDDAVLSEMGIRYFFVDTHGILFARPRPKYGVYAPITCPSGTAAFGRDIESSKQVWSANEGYPGDFDYREFYRDIGHDLDFEYIKPYIHPKGIRTDTGLKYYSITGRKTHYKQPYIPHNAREKAAIHAGNFMFNREKQIEYLAQHMDRRPIIVAPYDAELFGHWWFEGPMWLEYLIRKVKFNQSVFDFITPSEYLDMMPVNQPCQPPMCSWGYKGYSEVWLEGSNDWIYRHLHNAAERMVELANSYPNAQGITRRALNQAVREVFLAQASDWAFIMKTGTMVDYANRRTVDHVSRFTKLYHDIKSRNINEEWLQDIEYKDNIFPNVNYEVYQSA